LAETMGLLWTVSKLVAQTVGVLVAETYGAKYLAGAHPALHATLWGPSAVAAMLPRAYGLVALVNVVGAAFAVVALGLKVGAARTECGVDLPAMYATGTDARSVRFNCVQRGHQHALESLPALLAASMVGGVRYPVSVAAFGLLWIKARFAWAHGYASGDPKKRYASKWGFFIWTSLVGTFTACGAVGLEILGVL